MSEHPLFSVGFRPFFLVASFFSMLLMMAWIGFYYFSINLPALNYYPPSIWHAHEMIFGYSIAIIAGFLLTAIANWTGIKTVNGNKLALIVFIWTLGRLAPFVSILPNYIIAAIDLSFLPLLIFYVAQPLIKSANKRNYFIIGLLAIFLFLNSIIHLQILGYLKINPSQVLLVAIYLIISLITVMAGRVFPMFSQNGVDNRYQVRKFNIIEEFAVPSILLFILVELLTDNPWLTFIICLT